MYDRGISMLSQFLFFKKLSEANDVLLSKKIDKISNSNITNNIYKIRFENNKLYLYNWDMINTNKTIPLNSFIRLFKQLVNSGKEYDNQISHRTHKDWVRDSLDRIKSGNVWVYMNRDMPIAYLTTSRGDNNHLIIHELVVDSRYRNKGIGKYLLQFAEYLGKDINQNYIDIKVHRSNNKAIKLYSREGFRNT